PQRRPRRARHARVAGAGLPRPQLVDEPLAGSIPRAPGGGDVPNARGHARDPRPPVGAGDLPPRAAGPPSPPAAVIGAERVTSVEPARRARRRWVAHLGARSDG